MLMEILSAIKHTLNGNLSKSLDVLIQEKTTEINAKVDGVNARVDIKASQESIVTLQNTTDAIKSTVDTINQNSGSQNRAKVFKSNGTFVVPNGVECVYITATAAGGDGGNAVAGSNGTKYCTNGAGGGASGESVTKYKMLVAPNSEIPIVVGTGNTVIADLVLTKGGNGGNPPASAGGTVTGIGGIAGVLNGVNGHTPPVTNTALPNDTVSGYGGYSRMGLYDTVFNTNVAVPVMCSTLGSTPPVLGNKHGINATKYGCGGSGAGGALSNSSFNGGKGAPGIVIIEW